MAEVSSAGAEPPVHNEVSGSHTGPVIQANSIGVVNVGGVPAQAPHGELAQTADRLAAAVEERWLREEERRKIQDPRPLPVRWKTARKGLMDHWENILRTSYGETADPLDLDGCLDRIAETYEKIPSRRLVVLGRAGSGKTILGLRFVLDRLQARASGEPVPEIFSLGSWNPTTDPLVDWLSSQLIRDQPGLATIGDDGRTLAAALVARGLILPVLDGFDEIAERLRPAALKELSHLSLLPLVLTSRSDEYAAAKRKSTRGLTHAAAVELTDLTLADSGKYLILSSPEDAMPEWGRVLAELRDRPEAPLSAVLATPLMVSLARTIYSESDESEPENEDEVESGEPKRSPAALLEDGRFTTREALEDHLLSSFIPSVYQRRPGDRRTAPARSWNPQRAHRWLGYLAHHLKQLDTPDLAWWKLGTSMSRWTRTVLIAFLAGLSFAIVTCVGNIPIDLIATSHGLGFAIRRGTVAGLLHGLVTGLAFGFVYWLADSSDLLKPSPVRARLFGRPRHMGARFSARVMTRVMTGALIGFAVAVVLVLVDRVVVPRLGLDDGLGGGLLSALVFPPEVGLSAGLVLGIMTWLETPIDVKAAASCTDLLRSNHANVISHLLVWALIPGLVAGLVGSLTADPISSLQLGLAFGIEAAFGAGIGYCLCLTAWGQWVALARIWLPLTGQLPWRLVAFLEDACERGALRRAGAVYQFRHARLQNHLTGAGKTEGEGLR
ncbi:NACHT domain-containing protein [Streptomyces pinistramenti]|uniref:NACHT domain-containing protein n=1 Tax=Streptomyces pinistramenti TaxID=2884812 RepID=UPI001D07B639|nr:NACHT domain-containing protein [Streptomyces pinistramenti]MCB5907367.1 NACHT domain-containing protein [Streptomyces pinistramenti]